MTTPDHSSQSQSQFDTWLDAFVAGTSTPASRAASDSGTSDVRDAARQFHGLARRAEQQLSGPSIATSWEDFMNTNPASFAAPTTATSPPGPMARSAPGDRTRSWDRIASTLLAAALVLAVSAGLFRATGGFNGIGGGDDPGGGQQAAFAPETRVFTPEAGEATPEDLPVVPTAAECTVAPLTIDEVLWYLEDPGAASHYRNQDQAATAMANASVPQTPLPAASPDVFFETPIQNYEPGPAAADQLAAIASVERMWMACVLADSPFQRWALESPELVAGQVQMLLPNYASRDDVRAILEEVEDTGVLEPSDDFWKQPGASYQMVTSKGFPAMYNAAVVDPATAQSWSTDGRIFTVGYTWYDSRDGVEPHTSPIVTAPGTETPVIDPTDPQPEFNKCSTFELTWFPDREDLLISRYPTCG